MGELVPVFFGFVVGLIGSRVPTPRMRSIVMGVLSILSGVAATILVGEAMESWAFALVDIGLVAFVAAITYGLVYMVVRRMAHSR